MTVGTATNRVQAHAEHDRRGRRFRGSARCRVRRPDGGKRPSAWAAGIPLQGGERPPRPGKFHAFSVVGRTRQWPVPDHGSMRILVTGHRGGIGGAVVAHLERLGHDVAGFDQTDGDDLLDCAAVSRAAAGCAAIVHCGALANDTAGSPEQIMAVNVLGTWHVLLAAESAAVGRVVHFSSAQVFGTAGGEGLPDYLPLDDRHPRRATRAYGLSKRLTEDLCAGFSARTGIASVALRPVWVLHPDMYQVIEERWRAKPVCEWEPHWEYGGFVDVRDVAAAVRQALTVPLTGHHRFLLCAADIAATQPSLASAARLAPGVPITDPAAYEREPWRALIDCSAAARVLGWHPDYTWSGRASYGAQSLSKAAPSFWTWLMAGSWAAPLCDSTRLVKSLARAYIARAVAGCFSRDAAADSAAA